MNIDQVQKKILKHFPNDSFKIIEYTNMKNPMILQCDKCNKIFTFQRAENFFRRKNGCNNCQDIFEWKKQKEKFLLWLQEHNEFKLIDDLDQIHSSQTHIKCQCILCGRIQENKSIYDYYANKKCFCQTKGIKKPEDQLKKDFENICIFLEEYKNTDTPILVKSLFCGHEFKVAPRDILRKPYLLPYM